MASAAVSEEEDEKRHAPVVDLLAAIISRGQETSDFNTALPADYLLSAMLALGRTAEDQVKAGRMTIDEASRALHLSFPPPPRRPGLPTA